MSTKNTPRVSFTILEKQITQMLTFQGEDNAEQSSNKNSQEKVFSGLFYKVRTNCDSTKPYNKSLINLFARRGISRFMPTRRQRNDALDTTFCLAQNCVKCEKLHSMNFIFQTFSDPPKLSHHSIQDRPLPPPPPPP